MIQEVQTLSLTRALSENSQRVDWSEVVITEIGLTKDAEDDGSGVWTVGMSTFSSSLVRVHPICLGAPDYSFSMRIIGWWLYGSYPDPAKSSVFVPGLIAEFNCVAGSKQGIGNKLIRENEFLCSSMTLVAGTLGEGGAIVSHEAGSWAKVELQGVRKIQFDFKQGLTGPAFGNALWAKTTRP